MQEHGTDRTAQILIAILFIQIFRFIDLNKNYQIYINHIIILLGLIISLKSFYILYLILVIPFLYILFFRKKIFILLDLFKNQLFYYFLFLILLIFSVNFINTGCIIYPVALTCFDNLDWAIGVQQTQEMNQHYQLWSKAGKTPNFNVSDFDFYLQNFNWVAHWIDNYFFTKVSDFILGLFFFEFL